MTLAFSGVGSGQMMLKSVSLEDRRGNGYANKEKDMEMRR